MPRQMKDSGVEWIGEIPSDWNVYRNKNCFINTKEIVGSNSTNTELLSLTTKGVKLKSTVDTAGKVPESYDTYQYVNKDDIIACLFDLDCSAVFAGISPYDGMVSPAYKILKCNDICIPRYIDFWFKYVFDGRKFMHYSKNLRFTLNIDEFGVLPILLPSVDEQVRIADFLDAKCAYIDSVIEKTKESIEEYKKLKQAIITEAVTKGVRGERPMKDSGIEWIGEIPKNWNLCKIKVGVSKVGSGKTPLGGADVYTNDGVLFLRSQNIYDTGLVLESPTYISEAVDEEMKGTHVFPGDVLLNITGGSIGRCCVFPDSIPVANVNQHVCIIRVNKEIFLPEYMHYYWISNIGQMAIALYQTGGNREGMSSEAIKNSPIPHISIAEQKDIISFLDSKCMLVDRLISKKENKLAELELYKKSLIYEYVTGKKEVPTL